MTLDCEIGTGGVGVKKKDDKRLKIRKERLHAELESERKEIELLACGIVTGGAASIVETV